MNIQEEKAIVDRIKLQISQRPKGFTMSVKDDEYEICIKHGVDRHSITSLSHLNHGLSKATSQIGYYTPRKGFYKITKIAFNITVPYNPPGVIELGLYAIFNLDSFDKFIGDEVLINTKPLYNSSSVGPKEVKFEEGMVISIIDSYLENNHHYKIIWNIINQ